MRPISTQIVFRFLTFAVVIYALAVLVSLGVQWERYQWDFKIYYKAFDALRQGFNPYDFLYLYPPVTIWAFSVFSLFTLSTASVVFLALKSLALVLLLYLWHKEFLPFTQDDFLKPVFLLLAFNATIYTDFAAGNISVFEQLALWLAFFFLMRDRPALFCALVVFTASFKLAPILFLILLPLFRVRRGWSYVALSLGIFVGLLAASYLFYHSLFPDFLVQLSQFGGRGAVNPSTFAFYHKHL